MTRNQDQCTSFFGGKPARTEMGYQMIKDVVNRTKHGLASTHNDTDVRKKYINEL